MRLLFLTPDTNDAIGGIKVIYKHVDILNANSDIEAYIYHSDPKFRLTWFENSTRLFCDKSIKSTDILVIPEIYAGLVRGVTNKKIIFNQNVHNTFNSVNNEFDPYLQNDILGVIVVSQHNYDYLSFAYPKLDIYIVSLSIDYEKFRGSAIEWHKREKLISVMPRRNSHELNQVVKLLDKSDQLHGYNFQYLDGMTEDEVVSALGRSRFFLSFGYPEGFPAPPREAIAAGNLVIGYSGFGGRELEDLFYLVIPEGDVLRFAKGVSHTLACCVNGDACLSSKELRDTYTETREINSVVDAYRGLIKKI